MPAAIRRPASNGTRASSRACITSVGTVTFARRPVTSISPTAVMKRAAFSGGRGHALHFVPPVDLLLGAFGHELRREDLPERRVFLAPTEPDQGQHRRKLLPLGGAPCALGRTLGKSAVKN